MDVGRFGQALKFGLGIISSVIAIFVASKQEPVQKLIRQQVGPSYSCNDKRILNAAELQICTSWQLSRLDLQLSDAYYDACGNIDKALGADEITWIKTTRNVCEANEACLIKAYNERLVVLKAKAKPRCI